MHKNRQTGIRKTRNPNNAVNAGTFDRTQVLADLRDMLTDMSVKLCKGRVRDKAAFDLKLRALKAFSYGVSTYSNVLDAVENEAIIKRLDKLEDSKGGSNQND